MNALILPLLGVVVLSGILGLASCQTTLLEAGASRYRVAVQKAIAQRTREQAAQRSELLRAARSREQETQERLNTLASALEVARSQTVQGSEECPTEEQWQSWASCPSPW